MSGNDFLLAHGEKLALAAVVGLSAWAVYGTITNPAVHPNNVTEEVITGMIGRIERARSLQPAPQIKSPPDYVAALKKRLDGDLPVPTAYLPWLTGQPDVGPAIQPFQQLYIYELLPPKVAGVDAVGNIELTVAMPDIVQPTEGRIGDNAKREWKSQGGKVTNAAERAGVYIEYSIGNPNGPYKPVESDGIVGGFAPLADSDHSSFKVEFRADAVWETYFLKVRLVLRATGFPVGKSDVDAAMPWGVLITQGRHGPVANWTDLEGKVRRAEPEIVTRFTKPVDYIKGELKPGEAFYVSTETKLSVKTTSRTRFAFGKSTTNDDNSLGAAMLVTTLLPPLPGGAQGTAGPSKWLLQPEIFKIKKGERLGGERLVVDPRKGQGLKSKIDLGTPFTLEEIKSEVERTLYYELDTTSREGGGGQRNMVFKTKTKTTEVAIVKNINASQTLSFPRLIRIDKPFPKQPAHLQLAPGSWIKIEGPFIYPDFDGQAYDEDLVFRQNPAGFKQRELVPTAPVVHEPNAGPIVEQRKRAGDDYVTDTKYIEFNDGRVFFWDPVNKRIICFAIPGSEAEAAFKNRKAPAPPTAPPKPPVRPTPPPPRRP